MAKFRWLAVAGATLLMNAGAADAVTLRYGGTTAALTMDPHATNDFVTAGLVRQVYDSLVGLDDSMNIVPGLATEWTYQGSNTWRFKLRTGVKFHDGSAMTADDVVFSVLRQKTAPLYTALYGGITGATKVDDTTVDVVSGGPDPILPRKMVRLFVMSRAWAAANNVEKVPDLGAQATEAYSLRHEDGTGPMKLVSQDPDGKTTFERNPAYWGTYSGNVDQAIYTPIGSPPTRVAALLSGQLDLITDVPIQDADRVKGAPAFKVQQAPQQLFMELEMDGTRDAALDTFDKSGNPLKANPFKDVRVRQAIAMTVDAGLIAQRIMNGQANVIGVASAPGFGGYQKDLDVRWPVDVNKAKALLTDAGYPNGFVTQLNCPLNRYVNAEEICNASASMLARIGIEVKVKGIDWPEFARLLVNGPTSSFHLIGAAGNSGDTQDTFVSVMQTRDKAKGTGGTNWAMWTNADFDNAVNELVKTFEQPKRTEIYRKALTIAKDQVHAVYLFQPYLIWGMKQNVSVPTRADAAVMLQNVVVK